MYGKYFASTFTGSMFGAGCEVFALWGYVIAMAVDGTVELNPAYLAAVLGATPEQVQSALDTLCAPDPRSRTPTADGARLIHESAFTYSVVNHGAYRAIRNEEERRAYNRNAKRKQRAVIPTKTGKSRVSPSVIDKPKLSIVSAHTEAEAETEAETKTRAQPASRARAFSASPDMPEDLAMRAGQFVQHTYPDLYRKHRKGARYVSKPNLDFLEAVELCRTWDDDRLIKIATVFLTTDHQFAENGSRTMAQFRSMASWCDSRLAEAGIA